MRTLGFTRHAVSPILTHAVITGARILFWQEQQLLLLRLGLQATEEGKEKGPTPVHGHSGHLSLLSCLGPQGGAPLTSCHTLSSLTSALALTQRASCSRVGPEFWLLCMALAISASVMGACAEPSKRES